MVWKWIVFGLFAIQFLLLTRSSFKGEKTRQPDGFSGWCIKTFIMLIIGFVYWKAGAFPF